jgi:Amt family ammonium transporter
MTQISGASGALTWTVIEAIKFRKVTSLGFVSGILAGLVVITPAAAVVQPVGALTLGCLSSIACFYALKMKDKLGYDDSLDCFGIHGIGSGLGVILLSFFIRETWMTEAAANTESGSWGAFNQLGIQLTGMAATIGIATVGTWIICIIVSKTTGFRIDTEREVTGVDQSLHGEHGYGLIHSD